jgi:serine protease DegQ
MWQKCGGASHFAHINRVNTCMKVSLNHCLLWVMCVLPLAASRDASASDAGTGRDALHDLDSAIERLVTRVAPSVVQIVAIPPKGVEDVFADRTSPGAPTIGSGVIVDANGYIVTNEHVVAGADEIDVIIPAAMSGETPGFGGAPPRMFKARLVGVAAEIDVAVLSVDATGLSPLRWADYDARQMPPSTQGTAAGHW